MQRDTGIPRYFGKLPVIMKWCLSQQTSRCAPLQGATTWQIYQHRATGHPFWKFREDSCKGLFTLTIGVWVHSHIRCAAIATISTVTARSCFSDSKQEILQLLRRLPSEFLHFTTHLSRVFLTDNKQLVKTELFYVLWNGKQFSKNIFAQSSKCPPPAETHLFRRLRKSLTALLIVVCGKSSHICCSALFSSGMVFGFGWSLWNAWSIAPHTW